jgi:ABC-type nitrate/sulfonate/bicarbonate transport system substrate-binding protein
MTEKLIPNARGGRRRALTAGLIAALALAVSACGASSTSSSGASAGTGGGGGEQAPSTVRIGLSQGYILNQMTVMLTQSLGYYDQVAKQFGTNINLQVETTNTIGQSAFFGNSIDLYQGSIAGLLPPAAKGEDVTSIFTHYTGTATVMIGAAKYKSSRGTNVKSYDGAHWCFTTVGSNSEVTSRYVAKSAGLDWTKQSAIAVGNTGALLPTMQAGRCDIAAMDTNSAARAISEGVGYLVQNPGSSAGQTKVFGGTVLGLVTWASSKFTSKYPKLTQALVDAQLRALRFEQQNADQPDKIYAALPKTFTETTTEQQFAAGWALFAPGIVSNSGGADASEIATSIALGNAVGANVKSVPDKTFNNSFARQAYTDLKLSPPADLAAK